MLCMRGKLSLIVKTVENLHIHRAGVGSGHCGLQAHRILCIYKEVTALGENHFF